MLLIPFNTMNYPHYPNTLAQGGQPRNGQQPNLNAAKQHGAHGPNPQPGFPNPYAPDPKFAFWILKRPISNKNNLPASWTRTVPQSVRVQQAELQEAVDRFRQKKYSVTQILSRLQNRDACELINNLIDEENRELSKRNPALQWTIGSIKVERGTARIGWQSKSVDLVIELVLQTEPNPMAPVPDFQDRSRMKQQPMDQGGNSKQGGAQVPKNGQNPGQHGQQVDPRMFRDQPPQQPPQGPPHGPPQFPPPDQGGIPPPPPPPQHGDPSFGPPPNFPPPPTQQNGPSKHAPAFHNQHNPHQQMKIPGAYPDTAGFPQPGQQHQRPQKIEVIIDNHKHDNHKLRKQKSKSFIRDERNMDSSSDSGSSSDDSRVFTRVVEDGEYYNINKQSRRSRSRHQSRDRARSGSRGRDRVSKFYNSRSQSRRMSETEHMRGDRYSNSPKATSPRTSHNALPQNHININVVGGPAEQESDHKPKRSGPQFSQVDYNPRRSSHSVSPTNFPPATYSSAGYKNPEKYDPQFVSHTSSHAGSDTGMSSFDNSSVHSADDSVFSEPVTRVHGRTHSDAGGPRMKSRNLPRPYEDHQYASQANPNPRHRRTMHSSVDYQRPRGAIEQYDDYPEAVFPHSILVRPRPRQERSMSYDVSHGEMVRPGHPFYPPPRQIEAPERNGFDLREVADAMDAIRHMESRGMPRHNLPRRRNSVQVGRGGMMPGRDPWANSGHYGPAYAEYDGYEAY